MNNETQSPSPIACDMSALSREQRVSHLATSGALFSTVQEIQELADGYQFRFGDGATAIIDVARFVSVEKLCCPFLNFTIDVGAEGGPIWLRLTGREGVKAFIREEISGLLGKAIAWT